MDIKLCDRCGIDLNQCKKKTILFIFPHHVPLEYYTFLGMEEHVHLCGNCKKKFKTWLKERTK